MLNRRRAPAPLHESEALPAVDVQRALRLGWAVAETFGRLRVYQPEFANKRNDPNELPRFSFSNSDLSGAQQLEVSYRRLVELAEALGLDAPAVPELTQLLTTDTPPVLESSATKAIHDQLEAWSRRVWIQLNVRSAALGRAMTYGGSLADTYWYMALPNDPAFLSGRQSIDALLREHRLRRMRERMDELAPVFSPQLCDAIGHSLGAWVINADMERWANAADWAALNVALEQPRRTPAQQLHFNLFRQVRTWRDLVFEARQPLDYVSPGFRRRANLIAGTMTILLVVTVAVIVGALVFGTFNLALGLVARPSIASQFSSAVIEAISALVTVVSTLAVIVAGLLARASRAVEQFDAWLEGTIIRRKIREEITVRWNDPPRRSTE